jgi:hypothetical protein
MTMRHAMVQKPCEHVVVLKVASDDLKPAPVSVE